MVEHSQEGVVKEASTPEKYIAPMPSNTKETIQSQGTAIDPVLYDYYDYYYDDTTTNKANSGNNGLKLQSKV